MPGGADVGSRLVAADMLLTRLKSQTISGTTMCIDRLTNDTARNDARQWLGYCEICSMWTTKAHWNAIALHRADSHVSAPLGRRFQNGQRQRIGNSDNQSALGLCIGDDSGEVAINATRIRPWNDDGSGVVVNSTSGFNLPAKRLCTGVNHIHALRVQIACKQNARALVAVMANSNAHSFSNGSCFIQQRCTGNRQAGKLGNERLEVEQKLQTAWLISDW